ncbi:MAG: minor capsid protein [Methanolobus sp.]|nr:minor capsid protein [Methanolobus sp.]
MSLLNSHQIRKAENMLISLFSRAIERSLKVRSLDYSREIPRNIRREFGSRTYAMQLDGILTEIIKQSLLYADGQMKVLSAAGVNESHILTKETVRLSTELGQNVAESIIRTLQDDKIHYQHPNTLARGLIDLWDGERYKAVRFTRTFTADVATATTVHRYRQYGVEYMEFDAELDDRTTDQCIALHGTIFDLSKGDVDMYRPPLHHSCRSGLTPIPITEEIDRDKLFENRDFGGFEKALDDIDTFNEKYRIDKFVLDQDISARIMSEKGLSIPVSTTVEKTNSGQGIEAIVRSYEAEIKNKPYENCYALDSNGNIVLEKSGTRNQIEITAAEGRLLRGTVFTHNHPGGSSFSMEDIQTGSYFAVREMRATGKYRTYVMGISDGSNLNYALWRERGYRTFQEAKYEVMVDHQRKYAAGLLTEEESTKTFWHEVWRKVSNIIPEYKYTWIDEQ